ncbi:MgtC/SapB family protein [Bacillus shivajii]|uniref:MgtC/SapB family protein n=1 Tax=Bacillus shivajii TaxID=1983719 RepID=UPI001CFB8A65|nr:MgtC/SapB family protein [Bacillus shivajii]UCZ53340.1 MgtC/SapB family protein [Bacillus shivajii]
MGWDWFVTDDIGIMTIRLVLAALLGGLVGVEREFHHHPAGFRTHMLVSVGSCLIMLLSFYGFETYMSENPEVVTFDPSRLAAYVVSGIGFLGAGTILVQGYTVRGLTTAASIWVVAGIGLTVGAGLYTAGILTTVIVILSLFFLGKINFSFLSKNNKKQVIMLVEEDISELNLVVKAFEDKKLSVSSIKGEKQKIYNDKQMIEYRLLVEYQKEEVMFNVVDQVQRFPFVREIYLDSR